VIHIVLAFGRERPEGLHPFRDPVKPFEIGFSAEALKSVSLTGEA
jgi:hypothetical protein